MTTTTTCSTEIILTKMECLFCETVGGFRHAYNLGRKNSHGLRGDGRDEETRGVYGEYVASLYLDRAWRAVVDNPWADLPGDVGPVQIKTTAVPNGPLWCHRDGRPDSPYLLVQRLAHDHFRVQGWLWGRELMHPDLWGDRYNNGRPAFWAPLRMLRDPAELREVLGR